MEKRAGVPTEREENDCRNAHSPELPTSSLPPKSSYIRGVASAERKSVESARVRKGRRIPTKRETDGDVDCRFLVGHAFPNLVALLVHDETADRRCVNTAVCTVISARSFPTRPAVLLVSRVAYDFFYRFTRERASYVSLSSLNVAKRRRKNRKKIVGRE